MSPFHIALLDSAYVPRQKNERKNDGSHGRKYQAGRQSSSNVQKTKQQSIVDNNDDDAAAAAAAAAAARTKTCFLTGYIIRLVE
jgi:hypothetical protein